MSAKKNLMYVLLAAGIAGAVAVPVQTMAAVEVYVQSAPPAPRVERVPAPRRGYVWSPGYWNWQNNHHVWVRGQWVRERSGYAYNPNRWVERDGRWYLERGRWDRARRDSDGDGVPDRRDARPNNPNRS